VVKGLLLLLALLYLMLGGGVVGVVCVVAVVALGALAALARPEAARCGCRRSLATGRLVRQCAVHRAAHIAALEHENARLDEELTRL
jgi:hypothetical protein